MRVRAGARTPARGLAITQRWARSPRVRDPSETIKDQLRRQQGLWARWAGAHLVGPVPRARLSKARRATTARTSRIAASHGWLSWAPAASIRPGRASSAHALGLPHPKSSTTSLGPTPGPGDERVEMTVAGTARHDLPCRRPSSPCDPLLARRLGGLSRQRDRGQTGAATSATECFPRADLSEPAPSDRNDPEVALPDRIWASRI